MYPGYSTAVQYSRIYSCRTAVLASALVMLPPPLLCLMFAACSLGLGNCLKLLSIPTPPGALLGDYSCTDTSQQYLGTLPTCMYE